MMATTESELLYPLTLFWQVGGHALPSYETLDGTTVPEPYRRLLVHHGDMTSRLEAFWGGQIILEVLHREHTPEAYRREVVLHIEATDLPVEYGAIEIDLSAFEGELRQLILEQHLPLGGLLNRFAIRYRSEPRGFLKLGPDAVMQRVFRLPEAGEFYGRSNVLLGEDDRVLARIVEVLRPAATTQSP
jgi:chorismate-pyruvate lyase